MDKNIKIIFFGTPDFVIPVIKTLKENFELIGIVTAEDQKVGRKQILTPSPVKEYALKHNIPVFTDLKSIANLKSDLFVVAAYGKIIPQNILDIPKRGAINIHPSLLPGYRGASPIQSAILSGDKISGITVIKMDEKMDHGPIIYAEEITISKQDNNLTLSTKMFSQTTLFLPKIIPAYLSGKLKLITQNDAAATYCKIIKKEDGFFEIPKNLDDSPDFFEKLDRMIRAFYPWPTAWTRWNGKIVKLMPDNMIQIEGKKPVKLQEFLRGYPNFPLKTF